MTQSDRRYLFIDSHRVRRWDNGIIQRHHQPEKVSIEGLEAGPPGSVDARGATAYGSVLKENGLLRMWYGVMPDALSYDEPIDHYYTAYAESDDGIHWRKPDLKITGQTKFPGNNLLSLPNATMGVVPALPDTNAKYLCACIHGDLEADISEGFGYEFNGVGTYIYASDDGLHWRQVTRQPIAAYGDVACLVVDPVANRYLLYQKVLELHGLSARRAFTCFESTDGQQWERHAGTVPWRDSFLCDDFDDLQAMQAGYRIADHYGVAIYRAGITYISVESIFQMGDPLRRVYSQSPSGSFIFRLGFSHDGVAWRYPRGRPIWMTPGAPGEPDAGFAVPSTGLVEHEDHLLLYYGADRYHHGWYLDPDFNLRRDIPLEDQRGGRHVLLARIRKDRFGSLAATYRAQVTVDAGARDEGDALFLNAACPHGQIRVAVSEHGGKQPLPGFTFDDAIPFSGDQTRVPVRFREADLRQLPAARPLMIHLEITRGEIFGYEWAGAVA